MIRSRTVNKIHELAAQGKSVQDIAITLGIARNTVRKYLRHPELVAMPHARPNRRSKLDPFKEQIKQWIEEDHCYNCEAMLPRLLALGYTGSLSVLKAFVHPLRPKGGGHYPVVRYETKPAEQVQFDWGEFKYEQDGVVKKLYGLYVRYNQRIRQELTPLPDLLRNTGKICLPHLGGIPHDRHTLATVPTGGTTRSGVQVAPETSSLATCTCHD